MYPVDNGDLYLLACRSFGIRGTVQSIRSTKERRQLADSKRTKRVERHWIRAGGPSPMDRFRGGSHVPPISRETGELSAEVIIKLTNYIAWQLLALRG